MALLLPSIKALEEVQEVPRLPADAGEGSPTTGLHASTRTTAAARTVHNGLFTSVANTPAHLDCMGHPRSAAPQTATKKRHRIAGQLRLTLSPLHGDDLDSRSVKAHDPTTTASTSTEDVTLVVDGAPQSFPQ